MMWFLTEKFKIRRDGTDQWLDLLLRKRASPKLDIESIRNSCTRDLRLAHSEFSRNLLPAHTLIVASAQFWFNEWIRWKTISTGGFDEPRVCLSFAPGCHQKGDTRRQ